MSRTPVLYWFRQDLRLSDLPGLAAARGGGDGIIPCFILDEDAPGDWAPGGASRWWLHHSLTALDASLQELGTRLLVRRGRSEEVLAELAAESGAGAVYCSRHLEPWNRDLEARVAERLSGQGAALHAHSGALLHDPDTIRTQAGGNFKVFTAFWKAARQQVDPGRELPGPSRGDFATHKLEGLPIGDLGLRPTGPDWAAHWPDLWRPGEAGGRARLRAFLDVSLEDYAEGRDVPAGSGTSRLSPHLHFGEISPAQVWRAVMATANPEGGSRDSFLSELGWREFNHYLLYHFPHIDQRPFQPRFGGFPWVARRDWFERWCKGQTGYPLVDAGMRELWHTGFMHNRVRMVCASFLTKHLLLPWQWGARWFWDTLVDADLANNSGGWQWVAGCGADAAPYFRIFNPVLQGEKFDPEGRYTRHWVPELEPVPARYLHAPWKAPARVMDSLPFALGADYPLPIVDHAEARESALAAYKGL